MLLKGKNSILTYIGLVILGAGILYLAWPPLHLNFLVFLGFVPLLMMEDALSRHYQKSGFRVFLISFFTFLLWNIFTTWWIWFASEGGAVLAILCNALLMSIPVMCYHKVKKRLARTYAYIALAVFWMGFEYFHLNWEGNWPWLNLGNCWAGSPDWVQWYEYTGTFGGSLWIWVVNILIYDLIRNFNTEKTRSYYKLVAIALVIGLPVVISYAIKPTGFTSMSENVVAVQPNIDPYAKFSGSFEEQVQSLIRISEKEIDSNTCLVVWPETAISQEINEKNIAQYVSIIDVHNFLKRHPRVKLISGINSYAEYTEENKSISAHKAAQKDIWYDVFNAGILMDTGYHFEVYHKSRLVPGVEGIPFEHAFSFLGKLAINMGGGGGSLGTQAEPSVFKVNDKITAAPVICYESIFGEYISEYVRKGANIITIFTNDGWWGNTDGYKQHAMYAQLHAIEERMLIVRAANTGTSCFILPNGEMTKATTWWQEAVIKNGIITNDKPTFYGLHGDLIGKISLWVGLIYFCFFLTIRAIARFFR